MSWDVLEYIFWHRWTLNSLKVTLRLFVVLTQYTCIPPCVDLYTCGHMHSYMPTNVCVRVYTQIISPKEAPSWAVFTALDNTRGPWVALGVLELSTPKARTALGHLARPGFLVFPGPRLWVLRNAGHVRRWKLLGTARRLRNLPGTFWGSGGR